QVVAVLVVDEAGARLRQVDAADARYAHLLAQLGGEVDQVVVRSLPAQVAEVDVLVQGTAVHALVRPRDDTWQRGARRQRRRQRHRGRTDDVLGLVGDEEVQLVADDGTAERGAILLHLLDRLGADELLMRRRALPLLAGLVPEEAAVEFVGARPRHRRYGGAADLVVLGLVVRGDDLVLADGQLRERIALAVVLAGDAARGDVVLLAHAVDVDVDVAGALCTAAQH